MLFNSRANRGSSVRISSRLTLAVAAASIGYALMGAPVPAVAADSSTLQSQLDSARAQLADMQAQSESIFVQLEQAQGELEDTNAQIATTTEEITAKQAELEAGQASLADTVNTSYKSSLNLIDVILGSNSLEDLVNRVYYANKVSTSQSEQIATVRGIQQELDDKKTQLEGAKADQEKHTQELSDSQAALQQSQADQQAYVSSLSAEVQAAIQAEREAAEAAAAAEAQRAAEAAAAAAAEQGYVAGSTDTPAADTSSDNGDAPAANTPSSSQPSYNDNNDDDGDDDDTPSYSGGSSSGDSSSGGYTGSAGSGAASAAVAAALSKLGAPYRLGEDGPDVFECSGLTWWAYRQAGVSIPRGQRAANGSNSQVMWVRNNGGWTTDPYALQAGDLAFYGSSWQSTYHVALCLGGGKIVHADGTKVSISNVTYSSSFVGGGPII